MLGYESSEVVTAFSDDLKSVLADNCIALTRDVACKGCVHCRHVDTAVASICASQMPFEPA